MYQRVKKSFIVWFWSCWNYNKHKKATPFDRFHFSFLPLSVYNSVNHLLQLFTGIPVLKKKKNIFDLSCLFLNQVLPAFRIWFPHFMVHCEDMSIQHDWKTISGVLKRISFVSTEGSQIIMIFYATFFTSKILTEIPLWDKLIFQ